MWPLVSLFALLTIGLIGALSELKRWAGRWGTRPEELARGWPGDELSPHATAVTTRAISIAAPADTVGVARSDRAGTHLRYVQQR